MAIRALCIVLEHWVLQEKVKAFEARIAPKSFRDSKNMTFVVLYKYNDQRKLLILMEFR
jgi:hypothetical protein